MKLLVLSDLQGVDYREWQRFLEIDQTKFDALLLLGDIDTMYLKVLAERFANVPIVGVLGNHDYAGDLEYYSITNLHGKQFSINGLSFAGVEGSVKYKKEEAPMFTQEEAFQICSKLPSADILISHNSPKGIHDKPDLAHEGFYGLLHYIEERKPLIHLHGHQHHKGMTQYGSTAIMCVYGGMIIDTETKETEVVLQVID